MSAMSINVPEFYVESPRYSRRIQKEMLGIQYKKNLIVQTITPFHYQIMIDNENRVWVDVDFADVIYGFEGGGLYVMRVGRRWDISKIDWVCGFKFEYLLEQCIFNVLHSPSGMMAHVIQKQRWGILRTAPMLMLWRKRATERLYHPSRIDFAKIMEED